jgi:aminopeptidase N
VKYLLKQKKSINNITPMLGDMGVNYQGWVGSDIYYKGAWLLHSLRNTVDNDQVWFAALKSYAETFKISQVTTEQTIRFFNKKTGKNLTPIFNQYLKYKQIPKLVYSLSYNAKENNTVLTYKWIANETDFNMPMKVKANEFETKYQTIFPTQKPKTMVFKGQVTAPYFAEELFYFDIVQEK